MLVLFQKILFCLLKQPLKQLLELLNPSQPRRGIFDCLLIIVSVCVVLSLLLFPCRVQQRLQQPSPCLQGSPHYISSSPAKVKTHTSIWPDREGPLHTSFVFNPLILSQVSYYRSSVLPMGPSTSSSSPNSRSCCSSRCNLRVCRRLSYSRFVMFWREKFQGFIKI